MVELISAELSAVLDELLFSEEIADSEGEELDEISEALSVGLSEATTLEGVELATVMGLCRLAVDCVLELLAVTLEAITLEAAETVILVLAVFEVEEITLLLYDP